jgi:hypothetical protein
MEAEETTNTVSSAFYPPPSSERHVRPFDIFRRQSFLNADERGYQLLKTKTSGLEAVEADVADEATTEQERTTQPVPEASVVPETDLVVSNLMGVSSWLNRLKTLNFTSSVEIKKVFKVKNLEFLELKSI